MLGAMGVREEVERMEVMGRIGRKCMLHGTQWLLLIVAGKSPKKLLTGRRSGSKVTIVPRMRNYSFYLEVYIMELRFRVLSEDQVLVCVYEMVDGLLYLKGVEESEIFGEGRSGLAPILIPSAGRNFPSLLMTFREVNCDVLKDLTIL